MIGSSQSRISAAIASHTNTAARVSQLCSQDLLPRLAENISTKAGATPGPWRLKALLLHADAIFKQGDAKRAKDNYISLRALAGDKDFKATVTKKIALCNAKLGLAERDGILN